MRRQLTDYQLVTWIRTYLRQHRYAPTVRDVSEALGVNISTTHHILSNMRRKGIVDWNEGEVRTLRVTRIGQARTNARNTKTRTA